VTAEHPAEVPRPAACRRHDRAAAAAGGRRLDLRCRLWAGRWPRAVHRRRAGPLTPAA